MIGKLWLSRARREQALVAHFATGARVELVTFRGDSSAFYFYSSPGGRWDRSCTAHHPRFGDFEGSPCEPALGGLSARQTLSLLRGAARKGLVRESQGDRQGDVATTWSRLEEKTS